MKVNCDHGRTLKATIIPLIQLIGGIDTDNSKKAWTAQGQTPKTTIATIGSVKTLVNFA